MTETITMETPRLLLRPWTEADAEALYKYASDPAVGPAAGWEVHTSVEESREIIRTVLSEPETYAVVWKESGEPIGSVGLMASRSAVKDESKAMELGYWVAKPFWGLGIMPEAVERIQKRAFEELDCEKLWCAYFDGNAKSARVMEKCGFVFDHTEIVDWRGRGKMLTEHFTLLTRAQWEGGLICRRLSKEELPAAMALAWEVYAECLAPTTSLEGVETFRHYVNDPETSRNRIGFGAFLCGELVGMMLIRDAIHISLFFVKSEHQRRGIGRALLDTALRFYPCQAFTVNAAPEAVGAYERMGFTKTGDEELEDGIRFVPMEHASAL